MIGRCVDVAGGKNAAQRILTRLRGKTQRGSALAVVVYADAFVLWLFLFLGAFACVFCVRVRLPRSHAFADGWQL